MADLDRTSYRVCGARNARRHRASYDNVDRQPFACVPLSTVVSINLAGNREPGVDLKERNLVILKSATAAAAVTIKYQTRVAMFFNIWIKETFVWNEIQIRTSIRPTPSYSCFYWWQRDGSW